MSIKIQAYFKSENDAETSNIQLGKYTTENSEMSKLTDKFSKKGSWFGPYMVPTAGSHSEVGGRGAFAVRGVPAFALIKNKELLSSDKVPDDLKYVLSLDVHDKHLDEVIHMLRENDGYVEVFE